jgi:hypothetical protein
LIFNKIDKADLIELELIPLLKDNIITQADLETRLSWSDVKHWIKIYGITKTVERVMMKSLEESLGGNR